MRQSTYRFVIMPIFLGAVVLAMGLMLVVVVVAGPYTHSNLDLAYDPSYTRTSQTLVGAPIPLPSGSLAVSLSADPVERGRQLFVVKGCATCHGLDGRGGIIGPDLKGVTQEDLRNVTDEGAKGMPKFAPGALSDDDLTAILAYLKSTKNQ